MAGNLTLGERVARAACELGDVLNPEKPNMLTINKNDLEAIIDENLEWWLLNVYDAPPDTQ